MRIAHTLYIDIVGFSKHETMDKQGRLVQVLTDAVHSTSVFSEAHALKAVLPVPAGDGMALVFNNDDVTAPSRCALEVAQALGATIPLRMGIHSGLVQTQVDISGKDNVVGEGINTAQRVMDQGDAGHILLSELYANWLRQSDRWRDHIVPVGQGVAKHGLQLTLFALSVDGIGRSDVPTKLAGATPLSTPLPNVVIFCRRGGTREEAILAFIETCLIEQGFAVYRDRSRYFRPGWAEEMRNWIQSADAVLAVVSPESRRSEMLPWELEQARQHFDDKGRPMILPLFIGAQGTMNDDVTRFLQGLPTFIWESEEDNHRIVAELVSAIRGPILPTGNILLEPVGGAIPLDSTFYIPRRCDPEIMAALDAHESILLVPGPRQVGKTSLLARAAQHARNHGARVLQTDFQQLNSSYLADEVRFYRNLAAALARQSQFHYDFKNEWDDFLAPNENLNYFLETLTASSDAPLVWCLDEADRIFAYKFASDFFGLVRSWHNARANRPDGPWKRLTLIIAYATEARLFISDLNQSPFNVGRKMELNDFDIDQFRALNHRYGEPLSSTDIGKVYALIGGQPFLSRKALDLVATGTCTAATLLADAAHNDGPFHDHLTRLMMGVTELPPVQAFIRQVLTGTATATTDISSLDRLLSAGVVRQDRQGHIVFRCELYRQYLASNLV